MPRIFFTIGLGLALIAGVGQAAPAFSVQGNSFLQFQGYTARRKNSPCAIKGVQTRALSLDAAELGHAYV
jgi:hypothetical protein